MQNVTVSYFDLDFSSYFWTEDDINNRASVVDAGERETGCCDHHCLQPELQYLESRVGPRRLD
jgi:hypothetical protein